MQTHSVPILPKRKRTPFELAHQQAKRAERYDRYQEVRKFAAEGMSIREIAQKFGMHRFTAQRFARSATYPERALDQNKSSILTLFLPYLQKRFEEGFINSQQLWREIQGQGFKGTSRQVIRWVQQTKAGGTTRTPSLLAPKQLVWVLFKDKHQLRETEPVFLEYVLQHETIQKAYSLVQEFRKMVHERKSDQLDEWVMTAEKSQIVELRNFASGMRQDYLAVRAALTEEWSNGQTEGQNTQLKLLKRQMYGRAKLDLLRQRVLYRSG
jgi:transposase